MRGSRRDLIGMAKLSAMLGASPSLYTSINLEQGTLPVGCERVCEGVAETAQPRQQTDGR